MPDRTGGEGRVGGWKGERINCFETFSRHSCPCVSAGVECTDGPSLWPLGRLVHATDSSAGCGLRVCRILKCAGRATCGGERWMWMNEGVMCATGGNLRVQSGEPTGSFGPAVGGVCYAHKGQRAGTSATALARLGNDTLPFTLTRRLPIHSVCPLFRPTALSVRPWPTNAI